MQDGTMAKAEALKWNIHDGYEICGSGNINSAQASNFNNFVAINWLQLNDTSAAVTIGDGEAAHENAQRH
jgi:hypothetical protein